jgi:predicted nucleic-acid-binding Zn-ribbon protein
MEMTLKLACPQCGTEFESAIQMDAPTWAQIRVQEQGNIERCSHCGYSKRYQKADYFFA